MGTPAQAPKWFGLAFVLIGIPLIIWDASGTHKQLAALDAADARKTQCAAKMAQFSISDGDARNFCGCIVRVAGERGITQPHGAYSEEALKPVVEECYNANVRQ